MGLFDFVTIRKTVVAIEEQLQKLQNEEFELRGQIAQINSAPASVLKKARCMR